MNAAHPTIQQIARAAGWVLDDPSSVRRMQAHNWKSIDPADIALIEARERLGSDEALGRMHEIRPSSAALLVDSAVLRLIAPLAHEIPQWRTQRAAGDPDELIAACAGTPETVVRLALSGVPGRPREKLLEQRLAEAARRWRAGEDDESVAAALERSSTWLRRAFRSGRLHLPPTRLHRPDLALYAGVSSTTVDGAWSRHKVLPPPDGRDSIGNWWWQSTIEAWVNDELIHLCSHCPARLPSRVGLRVHTTKMHGRPRA